MKLIFGSISGLILVVDCTNPYIIELDDLSKEDINVSIRFVQRHGTCSDTFLGDFWVFLGSYFDLVGLTHNLLGRQVYFNSPVSLILIIQHDIK